MLILAFFITSGGLTAICPALLVLCLVAALHSNELKSMKAATAS